MTDISSPNIPLSCYIRTLNEASRIGAVIQAVNMLGAEVIVIDSGSMDATREIAAGLGANTHKQPVYLY
jgi:glycosyltransferase involved in cell wall biosynthesis